MNRRSFLQSILAAGAAPWVMLNGVAGGVLMPVRETRVVTLPASKILEIDQWLLDSFPDIEAIVRGDIRRSLAQAIDEYVRRMAVR